jgi:hypothetical protein
MLLEYGKHFFCGFKKRLGGSSHRDVTLCISEWSDVVGLGTLGGDATAAATLLSNRRMPISRAFWSKELLFLK